MSRRNSHSVLTQSATPRIAVVIPTRDRGDAALSTVRSLLANDGCGVEIVVVDQSTDTPGRDVMASLPAHVRWQKSLTQGVANARNEGVALTRAPIIGFIDDDCVAATDWLTRLDEAFAADPRIGVVFGNTQPGPHPEGEGFVPSYVCDTVFTARSIADKNLVEGLSACMGTTRDAWRALHGFDRLLGAGGKLRSGAETDYTIRALLADYHVQSTPRLVVIHHGYRNPQEASALLSRYWYGTGATFAKHLRLRNWRVMIVLVQLALRWLRGGRSTLLASSGVRVSRARQLGAFARGFVAGLRLPADRATGHFRSSGGEPTLKAS